MNAYIEAFNAKMLSEAIVPVFVEILKELQIECIVFFFWCVLFLRTVYCYRTSFYTAVWDAKSVNWRCWSSALRSQFCMCLFTSTTLVPLMSCNFAMIFFYSVVLLFQQFSLFGRTIVVDNRFEFHIKGKLCVEQIISLLAHPPVYDTKIV